MAVLLGQVGVVLSGEYLDGDDAPDLDTTVAAAPRGGAAGEPLVLLVLGDSTAAGVGSPTGAGSVAGHVAADLAAAGRTVTVRSVARSGARTADLDGQVTRALDLAPSAPRLALVLVGANDATHLTPLRTVADGTAAAVRRLRGAGVAVVVGTCPDTGSMPAFRAEPERYFSRDEFHPSPAGYALWASVLAPAVRDAAGRA